jgi:LysM repeat protein
MADRSVTVRLRVEDNFSAPINSYNQKMQSAEQATQRMNTAATQSRSAFSGMGTAITGAIAAFGVMGVARLGEELFQTGVNAQRAGMLFESFGAQVGSTSALLERLRTVSRGAVDDISLMGAASSMLSMGIAKNGADVERLTDIAVTFAQAMGTDVASSIENMNMLISNQSYLRLDQMGIGSSQVRQLAEQYRRAGMDSSEAFTAAFMDVAEQKLPQMAAVADATVTEFSKLSAAMDNWWNDFGNRFAQGVNGLIGIAQYGGLAIQQALFGDAFGQASARGQDDSLMTSIAQQMGTGNNYGFGNIRQIMAGALNAGLSPAQMSAEQLSALFGGTMTPNAGMINQAARGLSLYQMQNAGVQFGAYTGGATDARYYGGRFNAGASVAPPIDPMQQFQDRYFSQAYAGNSAMYRMYADNTSGLFSQEQATAAREYASEVENALTSLTAIGADDSAVQQMTTLRDQTADWAAFVQTGAATLEGMSLAGIFGQGGGGRLGEIDAAILSQMEAQGASSDTVDALRRALGLDSGQLTEASLQFDEQIAPQLAALGAQWGADAVIAARTAYESTITDMAAAGQGGQTVDWGSVLGGATGLSYTSWGAQAGGMGDSYTVKAGDTASAIAAQYGVSVDSLGLDNPSLIYPGQRIGIGGGGGMGGGSYFAPENFDMLESSMMQAETSSGTIVDNATLAADTLAEGFTSAVDGLASGLAGIAANGVQIPIELVISGAGIIGQLVAAAVSANGGATPGASGNTGRSSSPRNSNAGVVNTSNAIGGGI